jgi:hypothetical protein
MTSIANRGRPAGEVRQAIFNTLRQEGAMPLCELAQRTQVGYEACRQTVSNGLRSERLAIVGHEKRPHAKQWVAMYDVVEPATDAEPAGKPQPGIVLLDSALRSWR